MNRFFLTYFLVIMAGMFGRTFLFSAIEEPAGLSYKQKEWYANAISYQMFLQRRKGRILERLTVLNKFERRYMLPKRAREMCRLEALAKNYEEQLDVLKNHAIDTKKAQSPKVLASAIEWAQSRGLIQTSPQDQDYTATEHAIDMTLDWSNVAKELQTKLLKVKESK